MRRIQFSRLKRNVEAFFAPALRGRVELRAATYRYGHENLGRGVIVVDGEEVVDFCTFRYWNERVRLERGIREANLCADWRDRAQRPGYEEATRQACAILRTEGLYSQDEFYEALRSYLALSLHDALTSENLVVRCLSLLDRRLGRKRLAQLEPDDLPHPVLRRLLALRLSAEGIVPVRAGSNDSDDVPEVAGIARPGAGV